ncbi:hypothetical protein H4R24_003527 [Coemansia sp. RSA 988]|nr:hypothetical protein H4R24_003527 [Coemansia sp. RSA 988]
MRRNNTEQPPRRFRFSPYNLFPSRSNLPSTSSQASAGSSRNARSADTSGMTVSDSDAVTEPVRMSVDSITTQDVQESASESSAAIGGEGGLEGRGEHLAQADGVLDADDTEHDEDDDVVMADAEAGALASESEAIANLRQEILRHRGRRTSRVPRPARMHTGNELLSRIVGRSVINSVAQELERRNTSTTDDHHAENADTLLDSQRESSEGAQEGRGTSAASDSTSTLADDNGADALGSHAEQQPQAPSQNQEEPRPLNYALSAVARVELYFRISSFIQSTLEAEHDEPQESAESAAADVQSEESGNVDSANPEQQPLQETVASSETVSDHNDGQSAAAASAETTSEPNDDQPATASRDLAAGTQFRLFLLPGAIDQALETYEREHNTSPAMQENASEDVTSAAAAASGSASEQSNPDSSDSASGRRGRDREQTTSERRRELLQRSREEKLQRLRNIARAMNDERRNIQFPVMMVGIRLSPELRQQARAASGTLSGSVASDSNGLTSNSSSSSTTSMTVETAREAQDMQTPPATATPTSAPNNNGDGRSRGFIGRVGQMLPSISDIVTSLRRIHNATTPRGFGRAHDHSDSRVAEPSSTAAPLAIDDGDSNDNTNQPGMAVFIMIHYVNLSNPMILPLVTHSLFPELVNDAPGNIAANLRPQASSGNSYDLFLEIANIIGQVTATTVTQDIIDKHLRKYRYEGRIADSGEGEVAVARLIREDGDDEPVDDDAEKDAREVVRLVSADQCPVCLESFEMGDVLRVLTCNHGLHKSCGDSWFTQGSNKCPICRSQAVHSTFSEQKLPSL